MNKTLVSAVALIAAMTVSAQASDLYGSSSLKDAPVAPATWTGPIFGVGVLGAFVNHDATVNYDSAALGNLNGLSGVGWGADFLAGYRYQLPSSRIVIGLEGEYDLTNAPTKLAINTAGFSANPSLELTDRWAILATAGFTVNPTTLAYVGGGYGQELFHSSGSVGLVDVNAKIGDITVDGAVLKLGVETKLPWIAQGLSARAEYEYFAANDATLYSVTKAGHTGSIADTANTNSVKFELVYQLGSN